jgi:hypothetical protein
LKGVDSVVSAMSGRDPMSVANWRLAAFASKQGCRMPEGVSGTASALPLTVNIDQIFQGLLDCGELKLETGFLRYCRYDALTG